MKKLNLCMVLLAASCLTSCGGGNGGTNNGSDDAEQLTEAQLIEKAKAETGEFNAYGNTSRITAAMDGFIAKYGEQIGLSTGTGSKLTDNEIYTLLTNEAESGNNSKGASLVLIQDSATLNQYRNNSDILTNYYPAEAKDYLDENELVPLVHQYTNKLFIWNNTKGEQAPSFSNVWELTEEKFQNKIFFKSPTAEQVNMNFLIMLTSDTWATKLAAAYKNYYGTDYVAEAGYENIGYKWIKEFLNNADTASYTSDTKMAAGVSSETNADKLGLFVLSKLRDSSVTTENLTVGAWQENSIDPFAGFMYAIYSQVVTHGPRPYTAKLFTNYLMTAEGFTPWSGSIGGYSSNKNIPVHEGDKELSFYKNNLVVEDGAYISSVKTKVEDYVNGIIGK